MGYGVTRVASAPDGGYGVPNWIPAYAPSHLGGATAAHGSLPGKDFGVGR